MAFNRDAEPHNLTTAERDQRICERRLAGESLSALAREYDISPQRVWQIVSKLGRRMTEVTFPAGDTASPAGMQTRSKAYWSVQPTVAARNARKSDSSAISRSILSVP